MRCQVIIDARYDAATMRRFYARKAALSPITSMREARPARAVTVIICEVRYARYMKARASVLPVMMCCACEAQAAAFIARVIRAAI